MLKPFKELFDLDLKEYISKKPTFRLDKASGKFVETGKTLDYINWADCITLLYNNGAESVRFGNIHNENGHPLFLEDGKWPHVRVWVEIEKLHCELDYPVIDGSTDIQLEKMVQSDIYNATQRAFVKCVAVNTGLGLKLWIKEEKDIKKPVEDLSIHSIIAIERRIDERITFLIKYGMDYDDILAGLGLNRRQFEKIKGYYNTIYVLEQKLNKL